MARATIVFLAMVITKFFGDCVGAQRLNITSIAGSMIEGGPLAANATSIRFPGGIAVDRAGNIFIADGDHRVWLLNVTTGLMNSVAGSGAAGFSGDGGPATSARLTSPGGVALDAGGHLIIADTYNNRIRRVAADYGVITTVAGNGTQGFSGDGGPGTSASLFWPMSVAVDAGGNVFIADSYNNRIRRVTASSGIITTVAGIGGYGGLSSDGVPGTSARLATPTGVAVDSCGNLLIADSSDSRIRMLAAGSGIITTVAGGGMSGFSGDGGAGTSARLTFPWGVAVDGGGNIFITDSSNDRIRRVAAGSGIITTVSGSGVSGFSGDGGPSTSARLSSPRAVAVDGGGNIFIADSSNDRIRRVAAGSGIITTVAGFGVIGLIGDGGAGTSARLYAPRAVTVDAGGNLLIADTFNHRIRRVSTSTGVIATVAGNGTQGFSGDGGAGTSASLSFPHGVAVDVSGNVYVADYDNHRIRRVTSAGVITTVAGNGVFGFSGDGGAGTSASLSYPHGVAVDGGGNVFIADRANNCIRRLAAGSGVITTVAGSGAYGFRGDGGPGTSANLCTWYPSGVAVDASGNIYIADTSNHRIRRLAASTGFITTVAGSGSIGYGYGAFSGDGGPATNAVLKEPTGVVVDANGNLFIADI